VGYHLVAVLGVMGHWYRGGGPEGRKGRLESGRFARMTTNGACGEGGYGSVGDSRTIW
jgi:hypothetical protein